MCPNSLGSRSTGHPASAARHPRGTDFVRGSRNSNPTEGQLMKLVSAHIEDLRTLYISNLRKALDMEQKITKALPDLIENSSESELAQAFRLHLEETKGHVSKIQALLQNNQGDDSTETCKV